MFQEYLDKGIILIPEKVTDSAPMVKWARFFRDGEIPSEDELKKWGKFKDANYAVVLGKASGIVAIDIDIEIDEDKLNSVKMLLGDPTCIKRGTKGYTLFYKYNGEKTKILKKNEKVCVEVLSCGQKTTIPPSKIPAKKGRTGSYVWIKGDLFEELTELKSNYLSVLQTLFETDKEEKIEYKKEYIQRNPLDKITESEIENILSYISPECDYYKWIAVGGALFSELGDAGFPYFDSWSSSGSGYNAKECYEKWKHGIRTLTEYNIGTLIYFAKQEGYRPPFKERVEYTVEEVDDLKKFNLQAIARRAEMEEKANEFPDWYNEAPPMIKEISDWITGSALFPQPIITMGAVISFLGYAFGKEFVFEGTKGNIYNINLARTGHGKDHIIKCLRGLAKAIGIKDTIGGGAVTSDTSIYEKIKNSDGKRMYMIDEVQGFIKVISGAGGNAREAGISGVLLQAFSADMLQSVEKANEKDNPTITIENPYISLIGFCTPEPFYDSVSSKDSNTGFLGRLSIFKGELILPNRSPSHNPEAPYNPPREIVEKIKDIRNNRKKTVTFDGLEVFADKTQVDISEEANQLCKEIAIEIDGQRRETEVSNDFATSNLIGRSFEISKKYMIVASQAKKIELEHVLWAKKVMEYNIGMMFNLARSISENPFDKIKKDFVDFIRLRGGVIEKSVVATNFRKFRDRREKQDVINDLLEGEVIKEVKQASEKKHARPKTMYVLQD